MNRYFTCPLLVAKTSRRQKIHVKGGFDEVAICSECLVLCVSSLINISTTIQFTPNENAPLGCGEILEVKEQNESPDFKQ
ncbi:hypothetical protein J6O07_25440 (plasmid) [Escherichia coli]|uniref:hypothetical protein n=1 Tax=Escherichia coli TaxID=562 RepID=UPI001CBF9162|nr:hypothetical protein [Escherichia coli]UAO82524.1 hypothetical protein J6O07_25440 [Escherichia coli]